MSITIPVHATIDGMHGAHGLRHDDFKQYHMYCTRRVSRLRHHNMVRKDLVHSAAYVPGEKTKRNAFCVRDVPDENVNHENFLLVVLVDAERAWAHSNELKALLHEHLPKSHQRSKSTASNLRKHALRRLRRAKQLAVEFKDLCEKFSDEGTKQEACAYAAWMSGNLALEVNEWKVAYDEFHTAISLCLKLAQQENDLEISDIFAFRANNVLKPLLKYCQYELKESGGHLSQILEDSVIDSDERESAASSLIYRGQTVGIGNKDLKVLLLKAESLEVDLPEGEDAAFLSLLSVYDDAQAIVARDLENYREMKAGPSVNAKRVELENISGYIKQKKLELSMTRHEKMIGSCTKIADSAHLYDSLLQDARAMCDLPGPEEEDEFFLEANANVLRVRAFRVFYVSQLYASLGKFGEAVVLIEQSKHLADQASEEIAACDEMQKGDKYIDELERLSHEIEALMLRFQIQAYLGTSSLSSTGDLFSRLNQFNPVQNVTELALIPLPAKPAFFDIAWNHANTFPRDDLQGYVDQKKSKSNSGLLSWFQRN
mmetsp:Transcript_26092/g.38598  ORF Transcript_26092/g.38598 Transcript_26092/m.38598 type:complete len:544 (-) Transcript_26092:104-1735(-)